MSRASRNRQRRRRRARSTVTKIPRGPKAMAAACAEYMCCTGPIARYPDGTCNSVPYRAVTRFIASPNSNGEWAFYVSPGSLEQLYYQVQAFVANEVTAVDPYSATDFTSLAGDFTQYRVNAAMVKVEYIHSSLENQGQLCAKTFINHSPHLAAAAAVPSNWPVGAASRALREKFLPTKDGLCYCAAPVDLTAREYSDMYPGEDDEERGQADDWESLFVYFTGVASTQVLSVTIIQDIELLPKAKNFAAKLVTPGPPANPTKQAAIQNAANATSDARLGPSHTNMKHAITNQPSFLASLGHMGGDLLRAVGETAEFVQHVGTLQLPSAVGDLKSAVSAIVQGDHGF